MSTVTANKQKARTSDKKTMMPHFRKTFWRNNEHKLVSTKTISLLVFAFNF